MRLPASSMSTRTGLYKGLVPSLYKAAVVSGVGFFVYEQTCRAIYRWRRWHVEND